jgi:hypothetical protein
MIDEGDCGATGGMKIGRGNRSTRRKPVPLTIFSSLTVLFIKSRHWPRRKHYSSLALLLIGGMTYSIIASAVIDTEFTENTIPLLLFTGRCLATAGYCDSAVLDLTEDITVLLTFICSLCGRGARTKKAHPLYFHSFICSQASQVGLSRMFSDWNIVTCWNPEETLLWKHRRPLPRKWQWLL